MFVSTVVFFLVLSVLIVVHELGHFIMARRFGVWVEEFGFGLPPRIFGKKIGETLYSLNLLPFGGFVKLHGEDSPAGGDEKIKDPNRAFIKKNKKTRFTIITAGVVMNFLLAIISFAIVYSFSGIPRDTKNVKVVEVVAGSPAQVAGLIVGDVVRKVGKNDVSKVVEFVGLIEKDKGKKVALTIERNSSEIKLNITPRETPPEGEGPLGVVITNTEIYFPKIYLRPFWGVYYGFKEATFWGKSIVVGLLEIIKGLFAGNVPQDIAGPVGIFAITSKATEYGILAVINFIGIMSVNLAILNILPFPALDGGRLLFIGIEKAIGRKVLPKFESAVHMIGMIILLFLLLAITVHDVQRLITGGGIGGFL
ncbi:MAG: M50 family metallopeptidase [bacterium]|nr:M50 family metallopeptidase [bacterium]